jgi:hypothetical protein
MKTKTVLFIVLGIVVLLAIGLLVFHKNDAPAFQPGTSSSVTPVSGSTTSSAMGTSTAAMPAIIHLTGGSHGATTELVVGQKLMVSATLPIAAGYMIDPLQYNAANLAIIEPPQGTVTPGETVTWEFVALKSGTTGITITATQGANKSSTVTLFTNAVSVK